MSPTTYIGVDELFAIEIEPEVRDWLEALPAKHFLKVDAYVGLLTEYAAGLSEPIATSATESASCAPPWTAPTYASRTGPPIARPSC